jgi:segregation and condensation protein B
MQEDLKKVEAVLFTTGKFLDIHDISALTGLASKGYLKELIEKLVKLYSERDTALEIIKQANQWKLTIRKEYWHLTEKLLTDTDMDKPTQETLAVVAYKSPVFQAEIIKIRGNGAYEHLKLLEQIGFISREKSGRTKLVKVAAKFYDYFEVVEHQLKSKMEEGLKKDEEN